MEVPPAEYVTVEYLKSLMGRKQLSVAEKVRMRDSPKATPPLSMNGCMGMSRGKPYMRQFNTAVYLRHDWLIGCGSGNRLYCFPCMLQGGGESMWTQTGVHTLNHLSDKIRRHENSAKHTRSYVDLLMLGRSNSSSVAALPLPPPLPTSANSNATMQLNALRKKNYEKRPSLVHRSAAENKHVPASRRRNDKVKRNRAALSRLITALKDSGKHNLLMRCGGGCGDVLSDVISLALSKETSEQQELLLTNTQDEDDLLASILHVYASNTLPGEIARSSSPYLMLLISETTNVSTDLPHVTAVLRYLKRASCPTSTGTTVQVTEKLLICFTPLQLTATCISQEILAQLQAAGVGSAGKSLLIAQSNDGVCSLSSDGGVHACVKRAHTNAHFHHHRRYDDVDAVIKKAVASSCVATRTFFSNLAALTTFFNRSAHRMATLYSFVDSDFNLSSIAHVYEARLNIARCCQRLHSTSSSNDTVHGAAWIERFIGDPKFLFWLELFAELMKYVTSLQRYLNGGDATIAARASHYMRCFKDGVQSVHAKVAQRVPGDDQLMFSVREICDIVIFHCQERFEFIGHRQAARLLNVHEFPEFRLRFPADTLDNVLKAYPVRALEPLGLRSQLTALYASTHVFQGVDAGDWLGFLHYMERHSLAISFPQVSELLALLAVTSAPVTASRANRCSTTVPALLKRFLTNSTDSNSVSRLNALATLSSFDDELCAADEFNEQVIDHYCKYKTPREHLLYDK